MPPDKSRHILVATSTFPRWPGDTEPSFVFDLSRRLRRKGYEVSVLAPHAKGARLKETMDGIRVYRYRYFFPGLQGLAYAGGILANLRKNRLNYLLVPFFLFFQLIALVRILRANRFDLVHAHWLIPQGLICAVVNNYLVAGSLPLICTSHGADIYALSNSLFRLLKKWTIGKCTHLAVVSSAMQEACLQLGVDKTKVSVISMGVDLRNTFIPATDVERKNNRLIFVGRLVEKKGIQILLDAMKTVIKQLPDMELLLVGQGPLQESLTAQVKSSGLAGNVIFKGGIRNDSLPALYSSACISIVPSVIDRHGDQEGLGLVMIEAMGCGCAVIASSLEPIKDVIDDGRTGLLFSPGNAPELADKILLLAADPGLRRALAERGRASVIGKYDWDSISDQYHNLIHSSSQRSAAAGGRS